MGELYGRRFPAFHRLDLRINRYFTTSKGRTNVFLEVVNLYNRGNVRSYTYKDKRDSSGGYYFEKEAEYWFRLLPSVGVSWTWEK